MAVRNEKPRRRKTRNLLARRSRQQKATSTTTPVKKPVVLLQTNSAGFFTYTHETNIEHLWGQVAGMCVAVVPIPTSTTNMSVQVVKVTQHNEFIGLRAIDKNLCLHLSTNNNPSIPDWKNMRCTITLHIPRFRCRNYAVERAVKEIKQYIHSNTAQRMVPCNVKHVQTTTYLTSTGHLTFRIVNARLRDKQQQNSTLQTSRENVSTRPKTQTIAKCISQQEPKRTVIANVNVADVGVEAVDLNNTPMCTIHIPTPTTQLLPADEANRKNSMECPEYAADIYAYWLTAERRRAPSATYMMKQTDINARMREILVDWMCEVREKFKFKDETFHLSVHLLDRFLERRLVSRTRLQLVGCTAMLLASKYEEVFAPDVDDFVCISDKAYTHAQIIAMEGIFLTALNFNLTVPLCINFLERYCTLAGITQDSKTYICALYYADLTYQVYDLLSFMPSLVGAAAFYLAIYTVNETQASVEQFTGNVYTFGDILACINALIRTIRSHETNTCKYKSVKKKYLANKYFSIASLECKGIRASDMSFSRPASF